MFDRIIDWLNKVIGPKPKPSNQWHFPIVEEIKKPTLKKAITRKEKAVPLKKSASPKAFKENIKTEIKAGKKPAQAVAIAYAEKNAAKSKKAKSK